jgi:ribosomal protein S18 acetylase RimI-like enzyme
LIRPLTRNDSAAVAELVIAAGLFPADEVELLHTMMADYFGGNHEKGHMCLIDVEDEPLGIVYYQPELATDRTWNVTMIGVRRDVQGQGRGAALMQYVERMLQADGQRMIVVDTSSSPDFALTRAFYAKCGYEEEARIRDFWAAGDDKIVFRKVLNAD